MNIFEERKNIQPYEYPELLKYMEAIQHSFWLPEHFTYDRDVLDFKSNLTPLEQEIIKKCMLAIGVVENKVKTFWARIDMRMPKPEVAMAGHTFGSNECFDDQTEILTDNGFKLFKDLSSTDKVAQYNLESKEISFVLPISRIEKKYVGDMHYYRGLTTNIAVTPNHEIITIHPSKKRYKSKSVDGIWSHNYRFPCSGYINNGEKSLSPIDRMLISLQADGSVMGTTPSGMKCGRRDVVWNIKKERKVERLTDILNSTGLEYKVKARKGGFTVFSLRLPDDIEINSIKTFDWVNLDDLNETYIKEFIEELSHWDCHDNGDGLLAYYNTNLRAIDKIQSLAILGGYSSYRSVNRSAERSLESTLPQGGYPKNAKTTYRLSIVKREEKVYPKRTIKKYDGFVYCVSVPDQNIITRRGGSVSIQGNCIHQLTYQKLLELLGLEKEFENIDEVPCMKGRGEYLSKYLKGVNSRSNKEFTKSLILFTLLIENASLFSQFLIVAGFRKYKNILSNFSAVIGATAREEVIHSKFGETLITIIKDENPDWFDQEMEDKIRRNVNKAYKAEVKVLDWIFENGELDFISKEEVQEYLKDRFNQGLRGIGYKDEFVIDETKLEKSSFFDVQIKATSSFDFFNEKSTDYSQNTAFNEEELWD